MNARDQIIGVSDTADGFRHAFRWTPSDGLQDLGTLGGTDSEGLSINAEGQITGDAAMARGGVHALIWTP